MAENAIENGSALEKFRQMIQAQGGNSNFIDDYSLLPQAKHKLEVKAKCSGYIAEINSEEIGIASLLTGAGRSRKDEKINPSAGIIMNCEIGTKIAENDVLLTLCSDSADMLENALVRAENAIKISQEKPDELPLIYSVIQ
jgi:thymidine phosphorylase